MFLQMPNLEIEQRILHEFCLIQHTPFQPVIIYNIWQRIIVLSTRYIAVPHEHSDKKTFRDILHIIQNNSKIRYNSSYYTPIRSLKVVISIVVVPSVMVVSSCAARAESILAKWIPVVGSWIVVFSSSLKYADRIEISSRFAKMLETTKANEVPNSSNVNCILTINNQLMYVYGMHRQRQQLDPYPVNDP